MRSRVSRASISHHAGSALRSVTERQARSRIIASTNGSAPSMLGVADPVMSGPAPPFHAVVHQDNRTGRQTPADARCHSLGATVDTVERANIPRDAPKTETRQRRLRQWSANPKWSAEKFRRLPGDIGQRLLRVSNVAHHSPDTPKAHRTRVSKGVVLNRMTAGRDFAHDMRMGPSARANAKKRRLRVRIRRADRARAASRRHPDRRRTSMRFRRARPRPAAARISPARAPSSPAQSQTPNSTHGCRTSRPRPMATAPAVSLSTRLQPRGCRPAPSATDPVATRAAATLDETRSAKH